MNKRVCHLWSVSRWLLWHFNDVCIIPIHQQWMSYPKSTIVNCSAYRQSIPIQHLWTSTKFTVVISSYPNSFEHDGLDEHPSQSITLNWSWWSLSCHLNSFQLITTKNNHPPNDSPTQANLINDKDEQLANIEFPIWQSDDVIENQINTSYTVFSSSNSHCLFLSKLMASINIANFNFLQLFIDLTRLKLIVIIDF